MIFRSIGIVESRRDGFHGLTTPVLHHSTADLTGSAACPAAPRPGSPDPAPLSACNSPHSSPIHPSGRPHAPVWEVPCTRLGGPIHPSGRSHAPIWEVPCTYLGDPIDHHWTSLFASRISLGVSPESHNHSFKAGMPKAESPPTNLQTSPDNMDCAQSMWGRPRVIYRFCANDFKPDSSAYRPTIAP